MDNINVSLIIPLYNGEPYISSTLESVISQDFTNFEVIIVDDGSTDNGLDIAFEILSKTDIPHKLIYQKNHGVSVARNVGLENARGNYIVFLDDDDKIKSNHISTLFKKAQTADLAYTNLSKVDRKGNTLSTTHLEGDIISAHDFLEKELKMEISFNFVQLIYKTSILKENNIRFRENAVYGEDTEFAYKALSFADSVAVSPGVTYLYLQRDNSAISTANYRRFAFVEILESVSNYFSKDLSELVKTQRIPKAIFGNMLYFFYNDYPFEEVMAKMEELDLFDKLKNFKALSSKDRKFNLKIKLFLLNPKLYYLMWKKFKNSID